MLAARVFCRNHGNMDKFLVQFIDFYLSFVFNGFKLLLQLFTLNSEFLFLFCNF